MCFSSGSPLCRPPWFIFHRHLKRSKALPSPHAFFFFSSSLLSLILCAEAPTAGLSQPAVLVRITGTKTRKEWSLCGISTAKGLMFVNNACCLSPNCPGIPYALVGPSTGLHPHGGKSPPPEGHDKGGFYVGFFTFLFLSMGGGELHLHPLLVLLLWSDLPVLPAPFFPLLFSSWIWIDLTVYVTLFVKMWSVICKLQSNCLFSFFILWEKDVKSIGVTLCWTRSLSK